MIFKKYYLYKHTNKINGKIYVGQTLKLPEERWRANGRGYEGNKEFYDDIKKYGWDNFSHEIIAKDLCKKDVDLMEKTLIACLNLTNPQKGYNKSPGVGGITQETIEKIRKSQIGKKLSNETRKKISESKKGVYIKEKNPFWGKHHSQETIQKIREKCKGRIPPNKGKKMSKENYERCKGTMFKKGMIPWNKWGNHSEETKQKIKEILKVRKSKGFTGHTHSNESKNKIREKKIGTKMTIETRKKMSESRKRFLLKKKGV